MRVLKALCWFVGLLLASILIVLAAWHGQLLHAGTHGTVSWYILLTAALVIPARFLSLAGAYLAELLVVGWPRSSLRMLWRPSASVRMDMVTVVMQLLLPQRHIGYVLSF